MSKILFRYGVFAILALMFTGVLFLLNRFDVRTKLTVDVVMDSAACRAYVARGGTFAPRAGDTLRVGQTAHGDLPPLVVDSVRVEPSSLVLFMRCPDGQDRLRTVMGGDTYASGYIFVGRERLRDKVLQRMGQ